jgi:RNA polymerase sigma-70 factor, ECF subfamily
MATLGERLAVGDAEAFAELYDACALSLHRWLTVRMGNRDLADDVLQETFVRVTRMRRNLRRVDSPVAYVFRIAQREASRLFRWRLRERGRIAELSTELLARQTMVEPPDQELAAWIAATLARLRDVEREVVELKIYGQLTFHEIAQVTGAPIGTVATRYRTALERMRCWMAKDES